MFFKPINDPMATKMPWANKKKLAWFKSNKPKTVV